MTIRPATVEDVHDITHVHASAWEATYSGIFPQDLIESMGSQDSIERRKQWLQSDTRTFVALEDNKIVGFCAGGRNREPGPTFQSECYAIYLLPSHQRKGIGKQLFTRLCARLNEDGHQTLIVWVLPESAATQFYETLGGRHIEDCEDQMGGLWLTHRSYGWFRLPTPSSEA